MFVLNPQFSIFIEDPKYFQLRPKLMSQLFVVKPEIGVSNENIGSPIKICWSSMKILGSSKNAGVLK